MPKERHIYALIGWTVEKREKGWYFAPWTNRHSQAEWCGSYRSEASVSLMIARQLRREISTSGCTNKSRFHLVAL